jgi:hypothetical protein
MRRTNHLEKSYVPGLSEFNYHVVASIKSGILGAQFEALHQLRQEKKEVLSNLANYFRERLPHWPNKLPDFLFCKYVLRRLAVGMDDIYKRDFSEDFFVKMVVNVRFDKVAVVKKQKRGERKPCVVHKDRLGNSEGRCHWCYQRIRSLVTAGVVVDKISNKILLQILNLPSYAKTGKQGGFIKAARKVIEEGV